MRNIQTWLDEYGESHLNATNKLIHWICVPAIFFSITALLYSIKLPWSLYGISLNLAMFALVLVVLYYISLSLSIAVGMLLFSLFCLVLCQWLDTSFAFPIWATALIIFVLAWIGQFYGHRIEGKKPSFLKDIQFLMIGPAWLMSFIYKRIGMPY